MPYKIIIEDRSYSKWTIYDSSTFDMITPPFFIEPSSHKLFTNDIFTVDQTSSAVQIVHSSVRNGNIPGILVVNGNKTYGRDKKNNKLLYKCVPDDMKLPPFLVPYELKHVGFSKVFVNLYVTFQFSKWEEKHPHGVLTQSIGTVDILDNFYEYQLYCKSLNNSIQKFQKDATTALQTAESHELLIQTIVQQHPSIENRVLTNEYNYCIFTIDPLKSVDFDDAFSLRPIPNPQETNSWVLSIYIANVAILMDALQLWESFSRRISTIYLPDKKRPMLPTVLSDCLCSLQEGQSRIAFVMDVFISPDFDILDIKYTNCVIRVKKNYVYDEDKLITNPHYIQLLGLCKELSKKYKYLNHIRNSHDVICYLMTFMNYHCALEMNKHSNGIFRSAVMKQARIIVPDEVPEEVNKFFQIWNTSSGQYVVNSARHELLGLDSYIHITSPIRRLVDLLNMIQFQENARLLTLSSKAKTFYNQWLNEMEYINVTTRSIRKMQVDCALLDASANDPGILQRNYNGYLFDKVDRNDGLYQYIVYLPEIKLSCRITSRENICNFECRPFQLVLFNNEETFKKKIRLILV